MSDDMFMGLLIGIFGVMGFLVLIVLFVKICSFFSEVIEMLKWYERRPDYVVQGQLRCLESTVGLNTRNITELESAEHQRKEKEEKKRKKR